MVLDVLRVESVFRPRIWVMRQTGRYLSQYGEIRKRAGSFLDLCDNPDLAVEMTLQPIRRFGFDRLDGEKFHVNLSPVYETERRLRAKLPDETKIRNARQ